MVDVYMTMSRNYRLYLLRLEEPITPFISIVSQLRNLSYFKVSKIT